MKKIQISPSILSADFSQLGIEIKRLEEAGADMVNDINPESEPPEAWKYAANRHGEINSNYGKIIFISKYHIIIIYLVHSFYKDIL